jgi:thiol-disulfide isomerase/thioredoxin
VVLVATLAFVFIGRTGVTTSGTIATNNIASSNSWVNAQLTDVQTGRQFTLSDFKGKPVLVELMAVWCPFCTRQQGELNGVAKQLGSKVAIVSIDIDPNETPTTIAKYVTGQGWTWPFSKDPGGSFNAFFQKSAPETPVIAIAPDGTYTVFSGTVTSASDFLAYLQKFGITG